MEWLAVNPLRAVRELDAEPSAAAPPGDRDTYPLDTDTFRDFLEAAPFPCWIKSEDGRYLFCNRAMIERSGRAEGVWIGQTDFELFPQEVARARAEEDALALSAGVCRISPKEFLDADGSTSHWQMHRFPLRSVKCGVLLACIAVDVTQETRRELEQGEANARLQEQVVTDPLTGLRNRRAFEERLEVELSIARRKGRSLAVILLDADNFKLVNDVHGHAAGDLTLIEMARVLNSSIRLPDFAARYGGEEFAVILPEDTAAGALAWAHRFEQMLRDAAWPFEPVTVSLGVAELHADTTQASELIGQADEALYQAKRNGRARAIVYQPPDAAHVSPWGLAE